MNRFKFIISWILFGAQEPVSDPEQEPQKEEAHSNMSPTKWEPQCWCGRKGDDVIEMQEGVWKCNYQPSAHTFADPNWEKEDKQQ